MMYDDVDVSILDSKDTFGVYKSLEVKSEEDKVKPLNKSSFKRDPDTKFLKTRKKLEDDEPETKPKFARKLADDIEPKFKSRKRLEEDDEPKFKARKRTDDESERKIEPPSADFKYKTAVTFQEKLSILEERDKYLRENFFKNANKNMSVIVNGTCPDMCPERERLLREIHCSFSTYEGQIVDNEMHVVPELLVKEYSRSSADQDEPLPHELRPEPVLIDTMNHILVNVIPKIEESIDITEWYHFCWDRLRSLRKDIIQQQLCSPNIVRILEQSARFHICCGDILFGADPKVFDEKINAENLVNCLQMLISMYEDLEKKGIRCENESEFRIYMMLLLLDSGDIPDVIRWNEEDSKQYASQAKEIFFAFKQNLYTRFFKLVKKTSYLNACILQRYFSTVKTQILNVLVNAYSSGSQTSKFPLKFVKKILEFDTNEETVAFIESHGFTVNYDTNEVRGSKASFTIPDIKVTCGSSYILRTKRLPILEAVTKIRNYKPRMTLSKVHSSFNDCDKLNEEAWNAEDQRQSVIRMFGDIYNDIDTVDKPNRAPTPQNVSPKPVFTFIESKPFNESPKESKTPEICSFNFKRPETPPIVQEVPQFTFTLPEPKVLPKPVEEPVYVSPKIRTPTPEFYDPEEATMSDDEPEHTEITAEPIVRKSEEVVDSLTNALQQFESLYSNFFRLNYEQQEKVNKLIVQRENRRLRKTVKNRLKRNNAKKYARLWRKKVEDLRKKREDFIDIVHLPIDQYLNLWGTLKNTQQIPRSIVNDAKATRTAVQWSSNILTNKCLSVNYIGDKLAERIINNVRIRSSKLKLKMKNILCWKVLVSLPVPKSESFYSFVCRVSEFCQLLFYKNNPTDLGAVETIKISGVSVYTSINVKTGQIEDREILGLTSLVMYVCQKQESMDEFVIRLSSVVTSRYVRPIYVTIIASNGCYKTDIIDRLELMKSKKLIIGWKYVKWDNFFTLPKIILNAAYFVPWTPSFQIQKLASFIENISGDFFLSLCYLWNETLPNTPVTYIKLYNSLLSRLKIALVTETLCKYNLAEDYLPYIIGSEKSSNTLTQPDLICLIGKYALISFTKWPPKSVTKMIKLLTKYCLEIDDSNTLLPNVLRLVAPKEELDVEVVSEDAPWIKVVEMWSKYNVHAVSKRDDIDDIYVVYDECKIKEITDGLWIYNCKEIKA